MSNIEQYNRTLTTGRKSANGIILAMVMLAIILTGFMQGFAVPRKPKLAPDHENFYKYARYLFTKMERKIFLNLPDDESREEFVRNFWEIRNPNPMSEENEFKIEMERRFEHVSYYLKEGPVPGWKTDRGRIYLILGPPSNRQEQGVGSGFARIIYWYYWESEIFVRFIDPNGNGRYQMDIRTASLSLLDEMEKRKYYIQNKDKKDAFETAVLKFSADYNKEAKAVRILLSSKNLNFEEHKDGNSMIAKVKVSMLIYPKKSKFIRHSVVETVVIPKEKLLKKNAKLTLNIPFELPKGKIGVDIIISDHIGDAVRRKYVKIKI